MQLFSQNLDHPEVTPLLDQLARDHAKLTGKGGMHGILLVDQDAKVIAKNSLFQLKKPWDMGAIGAALYGVSMQARRYFNCSKLERISIIFGDMQFFIHNIGSVQVNEEKDSRELLLVILADKFVKVGLVIVQMRRYAQAILDAIKSSEKTIDVLNLSERQVKEYLLGLKSTA